LEHLFRRVAIRLFVDSVLLHKLWVCHRRPERSFRVSGRQFHVCARCTGLIIGGAVGWSLIPLGALAIPLWIIGLVALVTDGLTQLLGWRTSNNLLRFGTGFGVAITTLPALLAVVGA
jgi:uncharacterized membrane protein